MLVPTKEWAVVRRKSDGIREMHGVAAAVKLAEALVDLGLTTSKVCSYADPLPKARPGWPVTR